MTDKARLPARQRTVFSQRLADLPITPRFEAWLTANPDWYVKPEHGEQLLRLLTSPDRDRRRSFSGSPRGTCERAQVFGFIGLPSPFVTPSNLSQIFNDGKWRHARLQMQMLDAGIVHEVERKIDKPSWRMKGSIDAVNRDEGFGVEIKGIGSGLNSVATGPLEHHKLQATTYVLCDPDIDRMVFFYEDKRSQSWAEHVFKPDSYYTDIVTEEIERLNVAVNKQELPPILKECEQGHGQAFNNCPYRLSCRGLVTWERTEELASRSTKATEAQASAVHGADGGRDPRSGADAAGTGGNARRVVRKKRVAD